MSICADQPCSTPTAMMICVLRARRALISLGSASASSKELV